MIETYRRCWSKGWFDRSASPLRGRNCCIGSAGSSIHRARTVSVRIIPPGNQRFIKAHMASNKNFAELASEREIEA